MVLLETPTLPFWALQLHHNEHVKLAKEWLEANYIIIREIYYIDERYHVMYDKVREKILQKDLFA